MADQRPPKDEKSHCDRIRTAAQHGTNAVRRTPHDLPRKEMDRLRCRQFRVRAAVHRRGADLREFAAQGGRRNEYRIHLGLRADHRLARHRRADAPARLHRRRAGHEDPLLHRFFPDRRGDVLRDGSAARLARVPHRVRAGHDRLERLAHLLRFDAGGHDIE